MGRKIKPELRKKLSKLESVVLGVVLTGIGICFVYGTFKGCEYLSKRLANFDNSYKTAPLDKNYNGMQWR